MTDHIWAVVTSFRPDNTLHRVVSSIRPQVAGVVVVDDGSGSDFDDVLTTVQSDEVVVERLPTNSGIAAALNRGIRLSLDLGAEVIVTLDQDSSVERDFTDRLLGTRASAESEGVRVGVVVPEYFAGVRQAHSATVGGTLRARNVIQSGMLLTAETLHSVGGMFEPFFIDLVDVEFEMRCADHGLVAVAAPGLRLEHRLGSRYQSRGRIPLPVMTLSTPFRYYYRARNRVLLNRRYLRSHPVHLLRTTLLDGIHFVLAWSVAQPRGDMRRLISAGIRDGWKGKGGRISAELDALASGIRWNADRID
ncbi:glycosyltransferase [Microbacterium sp. P02]|uniref:glycosyltransferase n=1 Tax=Microbacterium sp. P02 TaxID=3366260 RepID=UPI00366AD8E0